MSYDANYDRHYENFKVGDVVEADQQFAGAHKGCRATVVTAPRANEDGEVTMQIVFDETDPLFHAVGYAKGQRYTYYPWRFKRYSGRVDWEIVDDQA